ncbi:MAG: ABC transporter permease subunit [Microthrixaceae bacterium]
MIAAIAAQSGPVEPLIRWRWVGHHLDDLRERALEHLWLTVAALLIGVAIASLLASVMRRWRWTAGPLTAATTILYTIPSIALFAALLPLLGVGYAVPIIALSTYSLVVLTPFLLAAFDDLDPSTLEAATAMGMTPVQRWRRVDLPLAMPTIVAGLRVTTVTIVGLVTVGGLFGLGGFGDFIDDGLSRDFSTPIVLGVVGSVVIALVADLMWVVLGRAVAPWQRDRDRRSP